MKLAGGTQRKWLWDCKAFSDVRSRKEKENAFFVFRIFLSSLN